MTRGARLISTHARALGSLRSRRGGRPTLLVTLLLTSLVSACQPPSEPAAGLPVSELLGGADDTEGFAVAQRGVEISLPADHGPHEAFRSEWWYFTAILRDETGSPFGVQFTIFRQALRPPGGAPSECGWCTDQAWMGHVAITDVGSGRHAHVERLSRGSSGLFTSRSGLSGARAEPFAVWVDGLSAHSSGSAFLPLRLFARSADLEIDLEVRAGGRLVLQGENGFSAKGPNQASHYFSMTRLPVAGRLRLFDQSTSVTGRAWLDREWSTSVLSGGQRGWDWLALGLNDGRDVMAFRLRRDDATRDPYDQAIVITPEGSRRFAAEQFTLEPTRFWTDERGARWPVAWRLEIESEVVHIDAMLDDQLMRTMVRYWEGLVRASNEAGAEIGEGYLELTGYEQANGAMDD